MPEPYKRSRSLRRVKKVTPGARNITHYEKRKPQIAHCGGCGRPLSGVPRERPSDLKRIPKTQRRPQRPYGGVLCTICTRQKMVKMARNIELE
ncbi:50S ribosomal protein L34e [Candidatus Woesearchaeota archaeon]|nr:50S ribosomal protein L34e [Candidatus Woesearchaeota archaeon]